MSISRRGFLKGAVYAGASMPLSIAKSDGAKRIGSFKLSKDFHIGTMSWLQDLSFSIGNVKYHILEYTDDEELSHDVLENMINTAYKAQRSA